MESKAAAADNGTLVGTKLFKSLALKDQHHAQ